MHSQTPTVAPMQRGQSANTLQRKALWRFVHDGNSAAMQSPSHGRVIYVVHVRNDEAGVESWATIVQLAMDGMGLDENGLAAAIGTNRTTVWRWLHRGKRPANVPTVQRFAAATGVDLNRCLRAAGFAPVAEAVDEDPFAYVREMGLDPNNAVVRKILGIPGISEDMRMALLRRERELQIMDERRRLQDLDWVIDQDKRRAG